MTVAAATEAPPVYRRFAMERALGDRSLSPESDGQAWIASLRADGAQRDQALALRILAPLTATP